MPVTHGVAGSSPVHSAKKPAILNLQAFFVFFDNWYLGQLQACLNSFFRGCDLLSILWQLIFGTTPPAHRVPPSLLWFAFNSLTTDIWDNIPQIKNQNISKLCQNLELKKSGCCGFRILNSKIILIAAESRAVPFRPFRNRVPSCRIVYQLWS